jgi:hypothetical protein
MDTGHITLEKLAWMLVVNDDYTNVGVQCMVQDDNDVIFTGNHSYDALSSTFEMLITLMCEMLFYVLQNNYRMYLEQLVNEETMTAEEFDTAYINYEPDLSMYTVEDLNIALSSKLESIGYILRVRDITDHVVSDADYGMYGKYYCKTCLLDDKTEKTANLFANSPHITKDKRFTFLLRNMSEEDKKNITDIKDVYSVCKIPPFMDDVDNKMRYIQIYFVQKIINE